MDCCATVSNAIDHFPEPVTGLVTSQITCLNKQVQQPRNKDTGTSIVKPNAISPGVYCRWSFLRLRL